MAEHRPDVALKCKGKANVSRAKRCSAELVEVVLTSGACKALDRPRAPGHDRAMLIYKIFRQEEWEMLCQERQTSGAPVDLADGYIHFSTAAQAPETAAKHFAGEEDLMLLAVETDELGDALKWESSRGGALFPHLYARLQLEAITWALPLSLENGVHQFPDQMV